MPPQESMASTIPVGAILQGSQSFVGRDDGLSSIGAGSKASNLAKQQGEQEEVTLRDNKGRPYDLGPEGFVRDLNTRAVKIARRIVEQTRAAVPKEPKGGTTVGPATAAPSAHVALHGQVNDLGTSGTVRSEIAQEIQFVLGGRLPFVKRWEFMVWAWVAISSYFIFYHGFVKSGVAPTVGSFAVMYWVLDFYSGVLHVVLDDEWNMNVPLLSQPAMEFQYHHHIPDDGCSRPFVEGMGDLNTIVAIHLALFLTLFVRGNHENHMLLAAGGWKMIIAYWGIWNHRQAHQLKSRRPRWCTYLQEMGIMLSPAAHKVHHTPPHDDEYCLLGVATYPVTWLGRRKLGSMFWICLFLVLTALDGICVSRLLGVIFA